MAVSIILLIVASVIHAHDIIYPTDEDTCRLPNGGNGICKDHRLCPDAFKNLPHEPPINCGFNGRNPIVCCPVKIDRVTKKPDILIPILDISPPTVDFKCGDSTPSEVIAFGFESSPVNSRSADAPTGSSNFGPPVASRSPNASSDPRFPGNDHLPLFDAFDPNDPFIAHAVGGERARRVLAKYTALIGRLDPSGLKDWFCTGILLNHQWVLTAAHCIQGLINIVRLGEHDYETSDDGAEPIDFNVLDTIPYPEYISDQGYHDLALLRLSSLATFRPTINPVCLPWGHASNRNLLNRKITLTGWGATEFRGPLSPILQEVNVTVFSNSICESSYSTVANYPTVFPKGIEKTFLCAGDPEGGKDACQGDSGGPVTYLNDANQYVLAGVVSTGIGCGRKDFPGLYANIHHPPYLAWIKNVAFQ